MSFYDPLPAPPRALESLGLDPLETGLLAISRHFLTAFARPETQAWETAFAVAVERWGEQRGPQLAQALLPLLAALRQARKSTFRFTNPLCPECRTLVTEDEAALCQLIQAMRRDQTARARDAVFALCEGRMDPALVQAGLKLAARFSAGGTGTNTVTRRAARPKNAANLSPDLRVVH